MDKTSEERLDELDEIADGAWGDNPMVRGMARDAAISLRATLATPAPEPQPEVSEELLNLVWNAILSCPHSITGEEIVLGYSDKVPGKNASAQLYERLCKVLATPSVVEEAVKAERCDGQLCYYHGCQALPGCAHSDARSATP